jgi:hypothetical protein
MILQRKIANIKSVKSLLDEQFVKPVRKWERVDDEDERSRIEKGLYHMENFTDSRWMYYHVDSGLDMSKDNFIISAEMRSVKSDGYYGYGLVFGFEKYATRINRYVYSEQPSRVVAAAFRREDSHSFERFSAKAPGLKKKAKEEFTRLVMFRLFNKVYFFLNDCNEPILEVAADAFIWTGNRFGFYTEPGMYVQARSVLVQKVEAEVVAQSNFSELLGKKATKKKSKGK